MNQKTTNMKIQLKMFEALIILEAIDNLYNEYSSLYDDALAIQDKVQIRRVLHTMLAIEDIQSEINFNIKK